jgi:hypothetical protein
LKLAVHGVIAIVPKRTLCGKNVQPLGAEDELAIVTFHDPATGMN